MCDRGFCCYRRTAREQWTAYAEMFPPPVRSLAVIVPVWDKAGRPPLTHLRCLPEEIPRVPPDWQHALSRWEVHKPFGKVSSDIPEVTEMSDTPPPDDLRFDSMTATDPLFDREEDEGASRGAERGEAYAENPFASPESDGGLRMLKSLDASDSKEELDLLRDEAERAVADTLRNMTADEEEAVSRSTLEDMAFVARQRTGEFASAVPMTDPLEDTDAA